MKLDIIACIWKDLDGPKFGLTKCMFTLHLVCYTRDISLKTLNFVDDIYFIFYKINESDISSISQDLGTSAIGVSKI
jgi:hypothetical protein